MANSVYSNLYFVQISEDGEKKVQELLSRTRKIDNQIWFGDIFVDGKDGSPTYEEVQTYGFTTSRVGPKWCFIEDIDGTSIRTESAWSWPEEGFSWLFSQVAEVDKNFIGVVTYEDEMPNFIGAAVYDAEGLYEYMEESGKDLIENLKETIDGLAEHWDEENEEFDDEGNEILHENLYEYIHDIQTEFVNQWVEAIQNDINNG
jgi:hypothetical protein